MRKPYPKSMYCPCGSNQKYRSCCQPKGIEYFIKESGKIIRHLPLSQADREAFDEQKRAFIQANNRQPTDEEEAVMRMCNFEGVENLIAKEMLSRGASEEAIYAFQKTGILATLDNQYQISPEELKRWEEAVAEYRKAQKK